MISKLMIHICVILLCMNMVACAVASPQVLPGHVLELQQPTTIIGIRNTLMELPGTWLFGKDNMVIFVWRQTGGIGMFCWQCDVTNPAKVFWNVTYGKGTWMRAEDFSKLIVGLKDSGYKLVPATTVLGGKTVSEWMTALVNMNITIISIPAGIVPEELLQDMDS